MKNNDDLRACASCAIPRTAGRYAPGDTTCQYCRSRERTVLPAISLQHARRKASASAPSRVPCAQCRQDRPSAYYPWIPGTASRGATCNACLRVHTYRGGRPRKPRFPGLPPMGPSARARLAEREAYWAAREDRRPLPPGLTSARARQIARWLIEQGIPGAWTAHSVYSALRGHLSVRAVWPACTL